MSLYRTVILDEHPIVMHGLSQLLAGFPGFEIVGTFTDSITAYLRIRELTPDLVILDLNLPGQGAIDLAQKILSKRSPTNVVFYTDCASDVFIDAALKLRAAGYLLKTEPVQRVATALQRIVGGETVFSERIMERVLFDRTANNFQLKSRCALTDLTTRQLQVLRHLAQGASVKEVADLMSMSQRSIESHKYRIMQKFGIHDRVTLTRFAIREGLLEP